MLVGLCAEPAVGQHTLGPDDVALVIAPGGPWGTLVDPAPASRGRS